MQESIFYTYYRQMGNKIHIRYKKSGDPETRTKVVSDYEPTLYLTTDGPSEYKTISGKPLKPYKLEGIREAKDFAERYKNVQALEVHGNSNYANQFIIELFEGQKPNYDSELIRVAPLDIEVHSPEEFPSPNKHKWPITAITVYDTVEKRFTTFGLEHGGQTYDLERRSKDTRDLNIKYLNFDDETALLKSFLSYMNTTGFDATSGWNSETFDIPYIVMRCFKLLGEGYTTKMLSPFNRIDVREKYDKYGKLFLSVNIHGLPDIDFLALYKKHNFTPRESHKLDFIASEELGERKISYEESQGLAGLYLDDYHKYIDYNVQDTNLIVRLNDKLKLFELTYALAYEALSNFEDTLGTVKIWENMIAKHLYNKGGVPVFRKVSSNRKEFDGAFVKEPYPGMYDWILAIDLNSLYPMNIIQYNIGPETRVPHCELPEELKAIKAQGSLEKLVRGEIDLSALNRYNYAMTANFEFYRKDEPSFFSEIMQDVYNNRKTYKGMMLKAEQNAANAVDADEKTRFELEEKQNDVMQMALKIFINSGYGAIGNEHFIYYEVENAEAITSSGQLINKWTYHRVNKLLDGLFGTEGVDYCVAGDTDSNYYNLEKAAEVLFTPEDDIQTKVDKIDEFYKTVMAPEVDKISDDMADYMNARVNKMVWSREVIAEKAIWVAKKKYAMTVWDNEGVRYKEPKLKITGLESVKSSTPAWSRAYLKECYKIALEGSEDQLQDRVEQIEGEVMALNVHEVAIPTGVNGIEKYGDETNVYSKGAQSHVKAALFHNRALRDLGIKRIQPITDGDKIKYVPLKKPNPINRDVIGFDTYLPKEFGLNDYVDYEEIYKKSFISPLKLFLNAINWEHEPTVTLF